MSINRFSFRNLSQTLFPRGVFSLICGRNVYKYVEILQGGLPFLQCFPEGQCFIRIFNITRDRIYSSCNHNHLCVRLNVCTYKNTWTFPQSVLSTCRSVHYWDHKIISWETPHEHVQMEHICLISTREIAFTNLNKQIEKALQQWHCSAWTQLTRCCSKELNLIFVRCHAGKKKSLSGKFSKIDSLLKG